MKRAVGSLVVLGLIGGAVWIGLTNTGPRPLPHPTTSPSSVFVDVNSARE